MINLAVCEASYAVSADDMFDRMALSTRALHTPESLIGLFPARSRWEGDEKIEARADRQSVVDAVIELERAGKVTVWEHPDDGPLVVLSAHSAERLKLELDGTSRKWRKRRKAGGKGPALRLKKRQEIRDDVENGEIPADPEVPGPSKPRKNVGIPGCTHFTPGQFRFYMIRLDAGERSLGPLPPSCPWCPKGGGCNTWRGEVKGFRPERSKKR